MRNEAILKPINTGSSTEKTVAPHNAPKKVSQNTGTNILKNKVLFDESCIIYSVKSEKLKVKNDFWWQTF